MKSQVKLGISVASCLLIVGGGLVHMTKLPKPGTLAVPVPLESDLSLSLRKSIESLRGSVEFQAHEVGRRSSRFSPRQQKLEEFLEDGLASAGLTVELQDYKAAGSSFKNIIGTRRGTGNGTLLIATHYDSYGKYPCANSSATGVAAMIEVASMLKGKALDQTIIFALFGTGEQPHRGQDTMGANVWLRKATKEKIQIDEALIVSSFGLFSEGEGIQQSSFPWGLMYPKTADWVAFYSPFTKRDHAVRALKRWGTVTELPARGFASPTWMLGMPRADQQPFLDAGIPTVVISDTGPERDAFFCSKQDDAYHLNYTRMALRVEALAQYVERWAGELTPSK